MRAPATVAVLVPIVLASCVPQVFRADHFDTLWRITPATPSHHLQPCDGPEREATSIAVSREFVVPSSGLSGPFHSVTPNRTRQGTAPLSQRPRPPRPHRLPPFCDGLR